MDKPSPAKRTNVIVSFQKGYNVENAKKIIQDKGMTVVRVYKMLSKSSGKPMILVRSPLGERKTMKLLKGEPGIDSVSFDHAIRLQPDPSKPQ